MAEPIITGSNANATPSHPYYPQGAVVDNYVANTLSAPILYVIFAICTFTVLGGTHRIIRHSRPNMPIWEAAAAMWFVLCGFIHLFFEGYFSVHFLDVAAQTDAFGQLWKEYSLSDSRYLLRDPFIVCMETVTAFTWGPLSYVCAYCIVKDHPFRHPLQMIISVGQLYGTVLYFSLCVFSEVVSGILFCRPESYYFWCYYFFFNAVWIVIPSALIWQSSKEIATAFSKLKKLEKGGKKEL
ncbi:related to emopamil-binding protein [Cephalotrichum gorgonifer]|uniref:Related to emopamil-binding protein n=1 Tax=Cephalotrichum gorgonifer TaxID=2041049 RepID=A0AAE8N7V5_9PEZI|nr:related to emopamil-binding protein [Cephalotrichum gorgonifer]